jgi:uncharacterized protein YukJ
MSINYAVLRSKITGVQRDDNDPQSPHFSVSTTDVHGHKCRLPVNVKSVAGQGRESILQVFRVDPLRNHPIVSGLDQIPAGLTPLPRDRRGAHTALDFQRAPLFAFSSVVLIPPFGPGTDDDLQDRIGFLCNRLRDAGGDLFAWGSSEDGGRVLHDIHMNQGNPRGGSRLAGGGRNQDFSGDNGVFQDGGLVFAFSNRLVGLFLKFQSQLLPTDGSGMPMPGAVSLPHTDAPSIPSEDSPDGGAGGGPAGPAPVEPAVFIERALVNPVGDDFGREIVVLGNATTRPIDLTGWAIVDKGDNAERLHGQLLPPGASTQVVLSGDTAQLSNKGGVIRLVDPSGHQVHAVSFSREQASVEGRFIRFDT